MSSLLQNVLASRLAQATIGGEQNGSASSSSSTSPNPMGPPNAPASANTQGLEDWENIEDINGYSDEELVGVMSAPGTVPGTPHISRPSSPGLQAATSSKSRRSALSQSANFNSESNRKSKTDPLRSLPREVSQQIFLSLPISSLISLSLINKRYRRSATLNYCWYRQCHSFTMEEAFNPISLNGGAKWTRRESKIDWKSQYAKQKRMEAREAQRLESLPGSGTATPSRTQRLREEGIKTPREIREEEWSAQEGVGYSKVEMREWYKSQGGSKGGKIKGKTGKGGVKTGSANDGSLWE